MALWSHKNVDDPKFWGPVVGAIIYFCGFGLVMGFIVSRAQERHAKLESALQERLELRKSSAERLDGVQEAVPLMVTAALRVGELCLPENKLDPRASPDDQEAQQAFRNEIISEYRKTETKWLTEASRFSRHVETYYEGLSDPEMDPSDHWKRLKNRVNSLRACVLQTVSSQLPCGYCGYYVVPIEALQQHLSAHLFLPSFESVAALEE